VALSNRAAAIIANLLDFPMLLLAVATMPIELFNSLPAVGIEPTRGSPLTRF